MSLRRVQQIAQVLQASLADILSFDEKMVLNFSHNQSSSNNGIVFHNELAERERELYERQIAHLKEEIAHLRGTVTFLQAQLQQR